jgi:hypothetical protein
MHQRKYEKAKKAYEFLSQYSKSTESFDVNTMSLASGLSPESIKTYMTKLWNIYLNRSNDVRYSVSPLFVHISLEKFLQDFSENRRPDSCPSDIRDPKLKAALAFNVVISMKVVAERTNSIRSLRRMG